MDVGNKSGSIPYASGLTLIELLIGLSIAIIVALLSTPVGNLVRSNKNTSHMYEFITTLNLARTEAIKYGVPVTVCRTLHRGKCEGPKDINGRKVWDSGWMVFYDFNGNGKFNQSRDTLLRVHEPLSTGYTLRSKAKVRITYKGTGIAPGFMDTWTFCDPSGESRFARGVILAYSGRARLAQDTDKNGIRDNGTIKSKSRPDDLVCA